MSFIGPVLFSLLYLAVAWLVRRTTDVVVDRSESALWHAVFAVLILLAINKMFEGSITNLGRVHAFEHGWYSQRRIVQAEFIVVVAILCFLLGSAVSFLARHSPAATQIALIGTVMLMAFALVRDASLHQIDDLISRRIFGLKVNWIVDLGGLGLILLASRWRLRLKQKDRPKAVSL